MFVKVAMIVEGSNPPLVGGSNLGLAKVFLVN